jgi:hypothetical protein
MDKSYALACLHAYEALEALEDAGDEDATYLRDRLWERWIDEWEHLPVINGDE